MLPAASIALLKCWDESFYFGPGRFRETWGRWHANGWFGPAERIAGSIWFATLVASLLLTSLLLPFAHRRGAVLPAFRRSVVAFLCCGGLFISAVVAIGVPAVLLSHTDSLWSPVLVAIGGPLALLTACVWIAKALAGVQVDWTPELSPRCEGCGYDLTQHVSAARCPECGLDVAESLTPLRRRPGCRWEHREHRTFSLWLRCAAEVLVFPTRFYGSMRMRDPMKPSVPFALGVIASLVLGAAVVLRGLIAAAPSEQPAEMFLAISVGTLVNLLLAIGAHCLVTALAFWISRFWMPLPDTRWLARVSAYESIFAWALCVGWGSLFISFVLFQNWISRSGVRFILGAPPELAAVFAAPCLVILAALWRYTVIFRAIRWSNF